MSASTTLTIATVGVQNNEGIEIPLGLPTGGVFQPGEFPLSDIDLTTDVIDNFNVKLKSLQDQIDALP
jgi:hypothetical protein